MSRQSCYVNLVYYRLKCCMNWENKKTTLPEVSDAGLTKFHNSESQKVIAILMLMFYQLSNWRIAPDASKTFQ